MGGPATLSPPTSGPSSGGQPKSGQPASGGLKQQWNLKDPPPLNEATTSEQDKKFLESFKAAMQPVNNCLQYTKVNAEQAKHVAMEGKRDFQYASFQATRARLAVEEMKDESLEKVLTPSRALAEEAKKLRQDTEKSLQAWQAKEAEYNKSETQIQELEKWGDKEFQNLRKSGDDIRTATNANKYDEAIKLLDQHLTKLKPIHEEYLKQKAAKEKYEPALKSLEVDLGKASASKYKKLEPQTTEIANIKKQMEEAAKNKDYVKALELVTDLSTKVAAYLKALNELEEKKKAYDKSLGELKPKLAQAMQSKNPAVANMQKEILPLQGRMESAAQSGDYDEASKLLTDLKRKVEAILAGKEEDKGTSIGTEILKGAAFGGALGIVGVVAGVASAVSEGMAGAGALGEHGGTSAPGGAPPPTGGSGPSGPGSGGSGSGGPSDTGDGKQPPQLPQQGTRQKPTFDLRLTPSDEAGMGHLDYRHAPWSKVKDSSKYTQEAWNSLRALVDETAEKGTIGNVKPDAAGKPQAGVVYEHRFSSQVGVNANGKALFRMRVVVDANNHVTTTFPF